MLRRITAAACAVALGTGALVVAGVESAGAAKPVITATGNVHCIGAGKAKLAPPLNNTPAVGTRVTTAKFKMNCTGTTGNAAVTVSSAKVTATMNQSASGTCLTLLGTQNSPFNVDFKWKATGGKINPTHITYSNFDATATGFNLPGTGGNSTVTGSWAGSGPSTAVAVIPASFLSTLATACGGKGIKKIVFDPTSWVDI